MWAITSSSEMWPIGLKSAIAISRQAGAEADLAPERHRPAVPGEDHRPVPVEDAGERDREDLERHEGAGHVARWEGSQW